MQVYWSDAEHTIIQCDSEGFWTWEDYHAAVDKMVEMMRGVPHRVDIINYIKENSSKPKGASQSHFQRAIKLFPPNLVMHILVTKNMLARAMVALWRTIRGSNLADSIYLVASVAEAYTLIQEHRAKHAAEHETVK
jgi:hypothetical protein